MNIYVGNIPKRFTEDNLKQLFEPFGKVGEIRIIKDKYNNQSRGFGFVRMPSDQEAKSAINQLNYSEIEGQHLKVSKARPPKNNSNRGGFRSRYTR